MTHFHSLCFSSLIFLFGCSHGWISKPLQFDEINEVGTVKSIYFEKTYVAQLNNITLESAYVLVSVNLETSINLCGSEIGYPEVGKKIGYKMLLLPIPIKDCTLKILLRSGENIPSLNKVFVGSLSDLWILQIKRDAFLILFALFYLLFALISLFIFFIRFSDVRFLSLAVLLFTASAYSISIGNGLIGLMFSFIPDSIWPHILFGSLYLFPCTLLFFLAILIKNKWAIRFKYGAIVLFLFWVIVEIFVNFEIAQYNTFLIAFHLLCVFALLVYFPPAIRYLIAPKNDLSFILIGLSFLLFFGFLEMGISYITKSLEIPLLPFGIFVFLLSLGFWGFKSYQNLDQKFEHVTEIKQYRQVRLDKNSKNRISSLNEDQIIADLVRLMDIEKVYLDENLNLNILAKRLSIRIDQLSYLINQKIGKPFSHFLNEYRINEACNLLKKKETNILNVAFSVGFQSKSAFNSAFKKYTGKTPTEYRKQIIRS